VSRRRRKPARTRAAPQRLRRVDPVRKESTAGRYRAERSAGTGDDPINVYRDAAGYGRVMRGALVVALVLLIVSLTIRAFGHQAPGELGVAGAFFVLVFFSGGIIKHYRGLYRVRRHNPEAWRPSARFAAGMMMAPFGIGNPRNTRADTIILQLTGVLALVMVVLLIAVNAANR
jgi:hypothetical protein